MNSTNCEFISFVKVYSKQSIIFLGNCKSTKKSVDITYVC